MNKLKYKLEQFMRGRYGVDILGRDMLFLSMILLIISFFFRTQAVLRFLPFILIILMYFRMFSKNFSKRYNENRVYTNFRGKLTDPFKKGWKRIKDFPKYKYLKCPECKQQLRVPRGKKSIVVTCPKCLTKFDAKS